MQPKFGAAACWVEDWLELSGGVDWLLGGVVDWLLFDWLVDVLVDGELLPWLRKRIMQKIPITTNTTMTMIIPNVLLDMLSSFPIYRNKFLGLRQVRGASQEFLIDLRARRPKKIRNQT